MEYRILEERILPKPPEWYTCMYVIHVIDFPPRIIYKSSENYFIFRNQVLDIILASTHKDVASPESYWTFISAGRNRVSRNQYSVQLSSARLLIVKNEIFCGLFFSRLFTRWSQLMGLEVKSQVCKHRLSISWRAHSPLPTPNQRSCRPPWWCKLGTSRRSIHPASTFGENLALRLAPGYHMSISMALQQIGWLDRCLKYVQQKLTFLLEVLTTLQNV